jgi:hypothetical protein
MENFYKGNGRRVRQGFIGFTLAPVHDLPTGGRSSDFK